jgi:hypothetical protein
MPSGRCPLFDVGLRTLGALAAILRAAIRVGYLEPRTSLPGLVTRLRDTNPERTSGLLAASLRIDPALSLRLLEAMLPILPPFGAGRCLKRSLLLLDLWSRAGLAPSFRLGVRRDGGTGGGHAWVETDRADFRTFRAPDVTEVWRA